MGWPILVTSCALWLAMRTKKKATPSSTSSKELSSLHCKWICCCSVFISSSPQNFLTIPILSCRLVQCYPIVVQIHDHSFPPLSLRFLLFHVPSENPIIKGVNANESVTVWVASQSYMDSMVLSMAQWRSGMCISPPYPRPVSSYWQSGLCLRRKMEPFSCALAPLINRVVHNMKQLLLKLFCRDILSILSLLYMFRITLPLMWLAGMATITRTSMTSASSWPSTPSALIMQ